MQSLEGRVAVVTGAAGGIGFAIAERFVAEGVRVVMADIDGPLLAQSAALLGDRGQVIDSVVDVRDPDAVEGLADLAVARFGALHIAVNNAGVVNRGLAWELSLDEWRRVIDIDLWGVIHGVRSFVPRILATGADGHLVNVASLAAVNVISRLGPYATAKHGVLGLSEVVRCDLEEIGAPVGVSVVMPGRTESRMNPIGVTPASAVADNVVDAILHNRFYVFTDGEQRDDVARRFEAIVAREGRRPGSRRAVSARSEADRTRQKDRERERERSHLVRAVYAVMRRNGYANANITDILAEAGISTRAFYRHFASKDDLLIAMFGESGVQTRQRLAGAAAAAGTATAQLMAWVDEVLDMGFDTRRSRVARMFASGSLRGPFEEAAHEAIDQIDEPLRQLLARGAATGEFPGCDPVVDAAMIHAIAWRLFTDAMHGRSSVDRDGARAHLIRFVFPALGVGVPADASGGAG